MRKQKCRAVAVSLTRAAHMAEHFPGIHGIKYEGPASKNPLAFRYYNPDEVVVRTAND